MYSQDSSIYQQQECCRIGFAQCHKFYLFDDNLTFSFNNSYYELYFEVY